MAQLVERHLAKVETAGSSPVYRSSFYVAESHKMWGSAVFVYMCSDYIWLHFIPWKRTLDILMCPGIRFPVMAIIMESRALVFMPHQLTDFVDVDFTGVYQCADVGLAKCIYQSPHPHCLTPVPAVSRRFRGIKRAALKGKRQFIPRSPWHAAFPPICYYGHTLQ